MSDQSADHRNDVTFTVRAQPTPDVLPRVLDLFARRNLVPDRCASVRGGPGRAHLVFEIEIVGLAESVAERIAASMRQIINVDSVAASRGAAWSPSRAVQGGLQRLGLRCEAGEDAVEVALLVG